MVIVRPLPIRIYDYNVSIPLSVVFVFYCCFEKVFSSVCCPRVFSLSLFLVYAIVECSDSIP